MSREVIAVDVDEVLFPFVDHFAEYHNQEHGTQLKSDDFSSYDFEHVLDTSREEAVRRVYGFSGVDHDHISPLEESIDAIERLAEDYDLCVVTARHPQFYEQTRKWLDEHFLDIFSESIHIGFAPIMEKPQRKIDICNELGAIALIDDSLGHVKECAESGVEGVLFGNYPWNQTDALPVGVTRCEDWPAVLEHFNDRQ